MSSTTDAPSGESTTPGDELTARVAEIAANARDRARQTEQARRVPESTVRELAEAGFFKLVQPATFGGHEGDFDVLVEHIMSLAGACASTAWVTGLFAAHQWLIAGFPKEAQHDVWDDNPDTVAFGSYAPVGTARAEQGGYRLSGRWSFASGCDNADWAVCAAFVAGAEEGSRGAPGFFLVPAKDYGLEDDWYVAGLCGTGSKTLLIDDVFVPSHRFLPFAEAMTGNTPGAALYAHNAGFRVPMLSTVPSCLSAVAVGAALGAVEEFQSMADTRRTRGATSGGGSRIAGFATVQLRVAEAAAHADAAREVLLRDLRQRVATARAGREVSVNERILSRRGQSFSVSLAARSVDAINGATGGQGLSLDNPIQRAWRDVSAVSRHISLNWDAVGTMSGQAALGLPPQGQY